MFNKNSIWFRAAESWYKLHSRIPGEYKETKERKSFRIKITNSLAGHLKPFFLKDRKKKK